MVFSLKCEICKGVRPLVLLNCQRTPASRLS